MDNIGQARSFIEEFIKKMAPEAAVLILPQKDLAIPVEVKVEDAQALIGSGGQTLQEIQHLLKIILKRKLGKDVYIDLDINNYKKIKTDYLKELARTSADEVSLSKQKILLAPMPAYERRVVHMELSQRPDVTTESVGQGDSRKIVIKPR
jgi:spoIIIJ-associated protein